MRKIHKPTILLILVVTIVATLFQDALSTFETPIIVASLTINVGEETEKYDNLPHNHYQTITIDANEDVNIVLNISASYGEYLNVLTALQNPEFEVTGATRCNINGEYITIRCKSGQAIVKVHGKSIQKESWTLVLIQDIEYENPTLTLVGSTPLRESEENPINPETNKTVEIIEQLTQDINSHELPEIRTQSYRITLEHIHLIQEQGRNEEAYATAFETLQKHQEEVFSYNEAKLTVEAAKAELLANYKLIPKERRIEVQNHIEIAEYALNINYAKAFEHAEMALEFAKVTSLEHLFPILNAVTPIIACGAVISVTVLLIKRRTKRTIVAEIIPPSRLDFGEEDLP